MTEVMPAKMAEMIAWIFQVSMAATVTRTAAERKAPCGWPGAAAFRVSARGPTACARSRKRGRRSWPRALCANRASARVPISRSPVPSARCTSRRGPSSLRASLPFAQLPRQLPGHQLHRDVEIVRRSRGKDVRSRDRQMHADLVAIPRHRRLGMHQHHVRRNDFRPEFLERSKVCGDGLMDCRGERHVTGTQMDVHRIFD